MRQIKTNFAVVKVVDAHNVEQWTSKGWKLIGICQDTRMVPVQKHYIQKDNNGNSYSNGYPCSYTEDMPVKTNMYVLGQDENSTLGVVQKELKDTTENLNKALQEILDIGKERDALKTNLARVEAERDNHKSMADRRLELMNQTEKRMREMEKDLGKIRTAIGELKMKEITGR